MLIFFLDTSADEQRVERLRDAKDDPRSSSPANVGNTATVSAPAAKITRPEWARPPTIASRVVAPV